jgi:hypothetical protein
MGKRDCTLSETDIRRMVALLFTTDLTIAAIAERMSCSRSVVASVNRKFQVRIDPGLAKHLGR